jgi:hypothetical protein
MTAVLVVLLVAPAMAQNRSAFPQPGPRPVDPQVQQYRKKVDQEYQAATQKVPAQKKRADDPWADVRDADPAVKPKPAR